MYVYIIRYKSKLKLMYEYIKVMLILSFNLKCKLGNNLIILVISNNKSILINFIARIK